MSDRPTTAAELAASLREIAARLDTLGDLTLTGLYPLFDLQLWGGSNTAPRTVADRVAAVDALANALGCGGDRHYHGGTYRVRDASAVVGVDLSIYAPNAIEGGAS